MTRFALTLAALTAFSAAPAAAQQYDSGQYGRYDSYAGADVDIQGLSAQIEAAASRGNMSSQDASELRSQLRGLLNLQRQYASNGMTASERTDLQQRAQGLRNEIAEAGGYASNDGRPGDRYGAGQYGGQYGGRYGGQYGTADRGYAGSYDAYGNARVPVNNGGYGNSYRAPAYSGGAYGNAYGRPAYNGGAYNGGAYGGAYGNAYGNRGYATNQYGQYDRGQAYREDDRYRDDRDDNYDDEDGIELRVGDRATGDLYGVPAQYRARFRDTPYVYYRYGAGNIYQIDARTGAVTRVIPIGR